MEVIEEEEEDLFPTCSCSSQDNELNRIDLRLIQSNPINQL